MVYDLESVLLGSLTALCNGNGTCTCKAPKESNFFCVCSVCLNNIPSL